MPEINSEHRNQYALITGATSGIGYELAKLFANDGYNLILVARNEERLQEITNQLKEQFGTEVTPIAKDLFDPEAPEELYREVKDMGVDVDVLVNDAGQGEWGYFFETDLERDVDIIQLNIIATVALTKLFGQDMVARNEGKILQLGSEAGKTPIPLLGVYAATKAFVVSFSVALSEELKNTNITVTVLLPGATDTDFFHKAHAEDSVTYREKKLASPDEVAKDGYEALMKGESKIISGAKTKMHVLMADLLGDKASAAYMKTQMEPSEKDSEDIRTGITHPASKQEREKIREKTGKTTGDLPKKKPEPRKKI